MVIWLLLQSMQLHETELEMCAMHSLEMRMQQADLPMKPMLLLEILLLVSVQILPEWEGYVAMWME
jgi:hypothetical protein